MSDFQTEVEKLAEEGLKQLRHWEKKEAAEEIMRDYLNQEGMKVKSNSKLGELLDERHRIALDAEDDNIRLKAIDSAIDMASGNKKISNQTNLQFNIKDFVNNLKD